MEPYGKGNELLKLEELKKKLKQEGLFDKPKKKIPPYPSRIGLITSSNGAAVHDLIHSIQKHYNPDIFLFPTLVQSENAPLSIIESLKKALNYHLDVIIISRGGGSNEDLSCFNDENLIRFASNIDVPLVSAVGHSIDATLLDLIADLTCITPTEAGEKVVPDKTHLIKEIIHKQERLTYLINNQISCYQQRLLFLNASKGLVPPDIKINNQMLKLSNLNALLDYLFTNKFVELNKELHLLEEKLKSLNPLKILSKGYSIVYLNDQIITSSHLLEVNQEISITLNQGKIKAIISAKEE
jgi:exodeoxyribonuclease VII large subunit